ncbi:PH domain-containing protein [Candidatus Kaiserbacteria bacterium]|nr:MAG: PH domain-containing protein [Candidatus Kaiserbacteria bacterium]
MKTEKIQLDDDEEILLQVRKHWFVLCMHVISIVVLAILPLPFFGVATSSTTITKLIPINDAFVVTLYCAWLIILWMVLFSIWTNYYLDVWTVTNKRLIATDQQGFFRRTMSSFRLERMQDISVRVDGILATFLDYGTLEIQTAGEENLFKVTGIPCPADIKALIVNSSDNLMPHRSPQTQSEV